MRGGKALLSVGTIAAIVLAAVLTIGHSVDPMDARSELVEGQRTLSTGALEHDFGTIQPEAGILHHTFSVTNSGAAPVELKIASIGCGCLGATCPEVVAPNETARIELELNPSTREGPFSTTFTVTTNDPATPRIQFQLRLHAVPAIGIDPPRIQIVDAKRGETLIREFQIIARLVPGSENRDPPTIVGSAPFIATKHMGSAVEGRSTGGLQRLVHHYRMKLNTADAALADRRNFSGMLRVQRSDQPTTADKELPVDITFRHHSTLVGQTSATLTRAKGSRVSVRVWSRDGMPFRITKLVASNAGVTAILPESANKLQEVWLEAVATTGEPGKFDRGQLEIHTAETPSEPYRVEVLVLP